MSASRSITIENHRIADDEECYVIAEIGHNHQGSLETCKQLFKAAQECGAHAAKLQKRDNRALFTREAYDKPYENENSYGKTYGEHREFLEFGWDEYRELQAYAHEIGITFFSTAFDHNSADFLHELRMPAYKIASGDLNNTPLLRHIAGFGKPMIISTGGATLEEVQRAYDTIMPLNPQLCILQCTSGYPCQFEEMNLRVIPTFREQFPDAVIGLSGHDSGIAMAMVAYALGGRVIEKHFTLNRAMKGTDHAFSLERSGMQRMVRDLKRARVAMGDGEKHLYDSERTPVTKLGKKLVAARELPAGHVLAYEDLAIKSPADGLPPYEIYGVVGRKLVRTLQEDDTLRLEDLDGRQ